MLFEKTDIVVGIISPKDKRIGKFLKKYSDSSKNF